MPSAPDTTTPRPTNVVTRVGACQFHLHRWPARDDSAPTIVALHGFTGDGLDYSALRAYLGAGVIQRAEPLAGLGAQEQRVGHIGVVGSEGPLQPLQRLLGDSFRHRHAERPVRLRLSEMEVGDQQRSARGEEQRPLRQEREGLTGEFDRGVVRHRSRSVAGGIRVGVQSPFVMDSVRAVWTATMSR